MQGFNMGRYVPPEHEGVMSGNKLSGKHALGARAKKISSGILTVRFEMPYAVWCSTCPKPTIIGQGVRFNAEKKKVGNYHSSPIFSFRMKHAACGGTIEIRTDPQNTRYVVTEGGKARDYGDDQVREGDEGVQILTTEERERRRADAFAQLEGTVEEKVAVKDNKRRIEELVEESERHWEDPYEVSRRLRKGFRAERKVRAKDEKATESIKARMGLDLMLLPENEEDRLQAAYVEFGVSSNGADHAAAKPLFKIKDVSKQKTTPNSSRSKDKASHIAERRRELLQKELQGNTRASQNPFGSAPELKPSVSAARAFNGIRRQRTAHPTDTATSLDGIRVGETDSVEQESRTAASTLLPPSLVAYDSD